MSETIRKSRWSKSEKGFEYRRKYFWTHMDKMAARFIVGKAVKLGFLDPVHDQGCFDCGRQATGYDHYLGYGKDRWLAVQAVCTECHIKRETQRKVGGGGVPE